MYNLHIVHNFSETKQPGTKILVLQQVKITQIKTKEKKVQLRIARLAFDLRSSSIMVVTDPETWGRKHEMLWPQACWIPGLSSPLGPIPFIFMQFLAKSCQNTGFCPKLKGWPPPSGKSWIRH